MSHRIATQTQIKDKDLAKKAIQAAGYSFTEQGATQLRITSGPLQNATVNLTTGEVVGDTDMHRSETLGSLRKFYTEAAHVREIQRNGHTIETRDILAERNGHKNVIRMICQGQFA